MQQTQDTVYLVQLLEHTRDIIDNQQYSIPPLAEDIPIVITHADMGPHIN